MIRHTPVQTFKDLGIAPLTDHQRAEGRLDRQGQVTILPPGPAPKAVTAHHASASLKDHLAGFLAANNAHGFKDEDFKPDGFIMQALHQAQAQEWPTMQGLKSVAWSIKRHAKGEIKHTNAIELLAAVYGYRTYHDLLKASRVGHRNHRVFKNLRYEAQP